MLTVLLDPGTLGGVDCHAEVKGPGECEEEAVPNVLCMKLET